MAVQLDLQVRRFFCHQRSCPQRIFCERVPTLIALPARRLGRLNQALQRISLALGGEGGARLAGALALPTNPDTLLRRIRHLPPSSAATPRVVGVEDWAKRKGRSYGTIFVALERRVPIEVLPDREEATVRHWLAAHSEVQIIRRDRAPQYAEAARVGAPQAVQVVDRWHVLKNLGEAVQRVLTRQRRQSEEAAWRMRDTSSTAGICQNSPQIYCLIQNIGAGRLLNPLLLVGEWIFGAKPDRSFAAV